MATSRHSEYSLHRRVNFYEVDSAGIVHFSWFFRYMEEAEHALWRQAGLSIAAPGEPVGFPRVSASFDYHKPLRFEDEIDIAIRIVAVTEKTIRYTCTITKGGVDVATGGATIVCVTRAPDGVMRSTPIPDSIAARFAVFADNPA